MFSARKISHNLYYSFLTSFLFLSYSFSTSFFSLSLSFLFLNFSLPVSFSSSFSISFPLPSARTFSDKQAINYYFQGEGVTIFENCKKIPDNFCVIFFLFANNAVLWNLHDGIIHAHTSTWEYLLTFNCNLEHEQNFI